MNISRKFIKGIVFAALFVMTASAFDGGNISVNFTNCVETIGVGLVPTVSARQFVPTGFILAGEGQPVTPLVVRTASCGISVEGQPSKVGKIVQIGAVIIPPDFTGDINNYTFWYYTDDLRLSLRLNFAGVKSQFVPTLNYNYDNSNSLSVQVPPPGFPPLTISGTVSPSPQPAGSFTANWWQKTVNGKNIKMNTNVPVINIGGANLTLRTNPNNPLGQLNGGSSFGFPALQQFNSFANAQMNVSVVKP